MTHSPKPENPLNDNASSSALIGSKTQCDTDDSARESIFHHVVNSGGELVRDIPKLPPLCDQIPALERQRIDIGGCKLYVESQGEGAPLVVINGGPGGTHHVFHPYFSRAAQFARVVYYDQRGCGESDFEPGSGYTVDQAVEDLDKLRETLGIDKWIVLGYSYGGLVVQRYLLKFPHRVRGLVLVGAAPALRLTLTTRQYDFLCPRELACIRNIFRDRSLSPEQAIYNAQLSGDWKRQNYYRPSEKQLARLVHYEWRHDEEFRDSIAASDSYKPLANGELFHGCPVPVMLMEGRWDLTWNADKPQKLKDCFPGSRLVMFEKAGHAPFCDEPKKFFTELKQFMGSLPSVSPSRVAEWQKKVANRKGQAVTAAESTRATASDQATFCMQNPAPAEFDFFTIFWSKPGLPDRTGVYGFTVQTDEGEVFSNWGPHPAHGIEEDGHLCRSDSAISIGDNLSKLFGKKIVMTFWTSKGKIKYTPDYPISAVYKKKGRIIQRDLGIRTK